MPFFIFWRPIHAFAATLYDIPLSAAICLAMQALIAWRLATGGGFAAPTVHAMRPVSAIVFHRGCIGLQYGHNPLSGQQRSATIDVSTAPTREQLGGWQYSYLLLWVTLCGWPVPGVTAPATELAWKLTVGEYVYSTYQGSDVNLRWRDKDASVWAGIYSDRVFGTQARVGADTSLDLTAGFQLQPSFQLASMGFIGGSLNLQAGDEWYGVTGFGRTNTKPYFNLNFDPNDAVTLGAGHHSDDGVSYSVFVVADDRFRTGQRDWHANFKIPFGTSHGTFDLLRKTAAADAGRIKGWGFSANWDWPSWFVRMAYDPYQNFSVQNAWRFATGMRF